MSVRFSDWHEVKGFGDVNVAEELGGLDLAGKMVKAEDMQQCVE